MNRSVSETARVLELSTQQTKDWAWTFKEQLSTSANPGKGHPRRFTDSDVLALIYVAMHWEDDPDIENIKIGLNLDNHHDDCHKKFIY